MEAKLYAFVRHRTGLRRVVSFIHKQRGHKADPRADLDMVSGIEHPTRPTP
jgi:hypothetical protein